MKRILFISCLTILALSTIACASPIRPTAIPRSDSKELEVYVGEAVSSTLKYAGYLQNNDVLVFADWFNEQGNLYVKIVDQAYANFTAYGDCYSLTNIRVDGNVLRCDIKIADKW